ncbi:MAG: hypothetical protein JNL70_01315 [Saprospiraceae bacterium]|nr:hypothetical protein [Saprospiraceae bacterium]
MRMTNDMIDGIYNYCDGWCERCSFLQRCPVGLDIAATTDVQQEIHSEVFWQNLNEDFTEIETILKEEAEKQGFSFEMSEQEWQEYKRSQEQVRKETQESALMKTCKTYAFTVNDWQKKMHPFLENETEEVMQMFNLGLTLEKGVLDRMQAIKENLEVILWYSFFISAKFHRALQGKTEDDGWERANGYQRDFDGSAKIALIGAERSLEAWAQLTQLLPDILDEVLPLMAKLQKIIQMGDAEFPEARQFIRPGFDE